jgi:tRNA(Arg) A34 adenosine deaminase TadA
MQIAIDQAKRGKLHSGGSPFGAVIVKNDRVVARAFNKVKAKIDCTEHAEISVIRKASLKLKSHKLTNCVLYTSCEPCMMCMGTTRWADIESVYFGASAEDAKNHGYIYCDAYYQLDQQKRRQEFNFYQLMRDEAVAIWEN